MDIETFVASDSHLLPGLAELASTGNSKSTELVQIVQDNIGQLFLLANLAKTESELKNGVSEDQVDTDDESWAEETSTTQLTSVTPFTELTSEHDRVMKDRSPERISSDEDDVGISPVRASEPSASNVPRKRIAVAGTGGLARLIAHYIDENTSHHVVFLSRTVKATPGQLIPERITDLAKDSTTTHGGWLPSECRRLRRPGEPQIRFERNQHRGLNSHWSKSDRANQSRSRSESVAFCTRRIRRHPSASPSSRSA